MVAVSGINYDEGRKKNLKYQSVYIMFGNREEKKFASGNFVKDWWDMRKFQIVELSGTHQFAHSSTVDHFIMDGAPYDSAYLITKDEVPELFYGSKYDSLGIEFFVPVGTKPTWKELKEMCK